MLIIWRLAPVQLKENVNITHKQNTCKCYLEK